MKSIRPTPFGTLVRGLAAGAFGSGVLNLFFKATTKISPATPKDVFKPPEAEQREENATETVARRFAQYMLQRPLSPEGKAKGAQIVHYAFGAGLGAAYGLLRESIPSLHKPAGVLAYGFGAWMLGDNLVLPAFRLAAWPNAYPLKTHAYALAAHLAFAAAVSAAYETTRPLPLAQATATLWGMQQNVFLASRLPSSVRPLARALISTAAKARGAHPFAHLREEIAEA